MRRLRDRELLEAASMRCNFTGFGNGYQSGGYGYAYGHSRGDGNGLGQCGFRGHISVTGGNGVGYGRADGNGYGGGDERQEMTAGGR